MGPVTSLSFEEAFQKFVHDIKSGEYWRVVITQGSAISAADYVKKGISYYNTPIDEREDVPLAKRLAADFRKSCPEFYI